MPTYPDIKIVLLRGIDDSNKIEVIFLSQNMQRFKFKVDGNTPADFLKRDFQVFEILLAGVPGDPTRIPKAHVIFNSICDADSNKKTLNIAENLVNRLKLPVINHPAKVKLTSREDIPKRLSDIKGIRVPKTIRFAPKSTDDILKTMEENSFGFPFIFRMAGFHGGENMELIENKEQLKNMTKFPFDGRNYYIIEFLNYQSKDGFFRKYRFFVIDGKVYPRHVIISDNWNIHAADRERVMDKNQRLLDEERAFLEGFDPDKTEIFREMHKRLGLDYFGVDCNFGDNGLVNIFEVNCCFRLEAVHEGRLLRSFEHHVPHIEKIKEATARMILNRAKLAGIQGDDRMGARVIIRSVAGQSRLNQ